MRTLGVDMAAQPAHTAVCLLEWRDGGVDVLLDRLGAPDDLLVELATGVDVVGVDCPLGWPDAFVRRIAAHHRFEPPGAPAAPADLRMRATDHVTHERIRRPPLSVSTDKLGIVALRWIDVMARIGGPSLDRTGSDRVVETYPGGSLTCWGIDHRGYKRGAEAAGRREEIAAALRAGIGIGLDVPTATDDQLDAFVCALTARAFALGLVDPIPPDATARATREGWIRLPLPDSLPRLVAGDRHT